MGNLRFINLQVTANSLQDLQKQSPIRLIRNVTLTYELWLKKQRFAITDLMKEIFFKEYLAKKYKNAPDIGFYIKIRKDINIPDLNNKKYIKSPYDFTNLDISPDRVNFRDRRHKLCYIIVDDATKSILGYTIGNKAEAIRMAKNLYIEEGYNGDITCYKVRICTNDENASFKLRYRKNLKHAKLYIIFGYLTIK